MRHWPWLCRWRCVLGGVFGGSVDFKTANVGVKPTVLEVYAKISRSTCLETYWLKKYCLFMRVVRTIRSRRGYQPLIRHYPTDQCGFVEMLVVSICAEGQTLGSSSRLCSVSYSVAASWTGELTPLVISALPKWRYNTEWPCVKSEVTPW